MLSAKPFYIAVNLKRGISVLLYKGAVCGARSSVRHSIVVYDVLTPFGNKKCTDFFLLLHFGIASTCNVVAGKETGLRKKFIVLFIEPDENILVVQCTYLFSNGGSTYKASLKGNASTFSRPLGTRNGSSRYVCIYIQNTAKG